MRHCYEFEKVKRIVIGSGGSAFVDGGVGLMLGLGIYTYKSEEHTYPLKSRVNID